jgi:hypothetical protein
MFIALSTGLLLALAGAVRVWFPAYASLAWMLLLFGLVHGTFLCVQWVGCEADECPSAPVGRPLSGT